MSVAFPLQTRRAFAAAVLAVGLIGVAAVVRAQKPQPEGHGLSLLRDGRPLTVPVRLGELPEA